MKIGVFTKQDLHTLSIKNYINNVLSHLEAWGVNVYRFSTQEQVKDVENSVDLLWFPDCGGWVVPPKEYWQLRGRIVVTFHGGAMFSLPYNAYYESIRHAIEGTIKKYIYYLKWQTFKQKIDVVIAVSEYGKREFCEVFGMEDNRVAFIYHGVDFGLFSPPEHSRRKYFLHISQYQPKKNVDRIIEAYRRLGQPKPDLLLVVPGYRKPVDDPNIKVTREPKTPSELVELYQEAVAFVFPSLHETFGMPILEAMACGCPVVTSNSTACAEIADGAALLVDPYSVDEISDAIYRVWKDDSLAGSLINKGLERVRHFSWKESAREHLKIFKKVALQNDTGE